MKTLSSFVLVTLLLITVSIPAIAQQPPASCTSEEARQFDFWIGEWIVETADGQKAGENKISRQENGCLLREEWTSAGGGTGQSMNYYDPEEKRWNQVWVSFNGSIGYFEGGLKDGAMVLKGKWVNPDGSSYPLNGTWTPLEDGRVRQHFMQSQDGGETWTTWFDGYYRKK